MSAAEVNPNLLRTATDIGRPIHLSSKARALLADGQTPIAYLRLLVEQGHYLDALPFLAHGMLPREAVWWACLCARHAAGETMPPNERAALFAALAWVIEPSAANQQAARTAGHEATFKTPAGCAAQSAYWNGAANVVAAARMTAASVLLAAARVPTPDRSWTYRQFIALALDVDCGLNTWREKGSEKTP
ncbi:MAG TPA: hypothetical protein VN688_18320 [Gemmataceae bacterium]|nr:hypothetical protein [Gemmataceae bacterium]